MPAACLPVHARFFDEVGTERSSRIERCRWTWDRRSSSRCGRGPAPPAIVCADPFHVVQLATKALDEVRRGQWNLLRDYADARYAKAFKGARWCLLKNHTNGRTSRTIHAPTRASEEPHSPPGLLTLPELHPRRRSACSATTSTTKRCYQAGPTPQSAETSLAKPL